ncbi:unnamed protein product [Ostreobium quekettii]|uniref:Calcineurin-like phosphoesterase domain-containing protein n=1 Tax=Ostreobium quekettii TaxID=121088 RepID=A0A8S1J7P6_9CHLO|nr:unnamed protein product [Ostreobium quekettii]
MAPILNALGVHVACLGNHDLDFGLENFEKFAGACAFPWLVANILDKDTGEPIGGMGRVWMVETSGVKVGVVGLVEHEWLATLATVDEGDLHYIDFISEGAKQAAHLREQGAELVVAVTHMRAPNDRKLLEHVMGVDIVCGGHDHSYQVNAAGPGKTTSLCTI